MLPDFVPLIKRMTHQEACDRVEELADANGRILIENAALKAKIVAVREIDWAYELNWSEGSAHYTDIEVLIACALGDDA